MPRFLIAAVGLVVLCASTFAQSADPLRLVPNKADLVVKVDSPRQLIDTFANFPPLVELGRLEGVREQLDSTNTRRAQKLLAHWEKSLGAKWPELLDRLAGGGMVLALKYDQPPNTPAMLVIQSRDEELLAKAYELLQGFIRGELVRTDQKAVMKNESHRGFDYVTVGPDFAMVRLGSALALSNKVFAIQMAIDLHINGAHESMAKHAGLAEGRKMLDGQPMVWAWSSLKALHNNAESKDAFKYPRGDPGQVILFNGMLDVMGQSPGVAAGLYSVREGMNFTIRMGKGRDASPPDLALHLPAEGTNASLPMLHPPRTLFSQSVYLDLGMIWSQRDKLLTEDIKKGLMEADKSLGRFLGGRKLNELLTQIGPYHRVVVATQSQTGYEGKASLPIPAFATITSLRDPNVGQSFEGILRTVAFLVGAPAKLKLVQETIGEVKLVGYRFPERGGLSGDAEYFRFNYSPCFARVDDQFIASSTIELAKDLIVELQKPGVNDPKNGSPANNRMQFSSAGGAALLRGFKDALLTQTILDRAVPVEQAKKEAAAFVDWLEKLGVLTLESEFRPHDFRFDIRFRPQESKP